MISKCTPWLMCPPPLQRQRKILYSLEGYINLVFIKLLSLVITFFKSTRGSTTEPQCFKTLGAGPGHPYCFQKLSDSGAARIENRCVRQTIFLDSELGIVFWDSGSPLQLSAKHTMREIDISAKTVHCRSTEMAISSD